MVEVISEERPTARKSHHCMACEWLNQDQIITWGLTFSEYRTYIKASRNRFRIQPGDTYIRQTNKQDGRIITFKAIPEIHAICVRVDAYHE